MTRTWQQTGIGEVVPMSELVGLHVLAAEEIAMDLTREPFDGYVYVVDATAYYTSSTLEAMRYPAILTDA